MGEPVQFLYDETRRVRVVICEQTGNIAFHAGDSCAILGIINVSQAVNRLPNKYLRNICITDVTERQRNQLFVTEPGLYKLIMLSRKPEAEKFQEWVCEEVLPSIRKTGSYSMAQPAETLTTAQHLELWARGITTDVVVLQSDMVEVKDDLAVMKRQFSLIDLKVKRALHIALLHRRGYLKRMQLRTEGCSEETFREIVHAAAEYRCLACLCETVLHKRHNPRNLPVAEIDHVRPRHQGEITRWHTVQPLCERCHDIKTAREQRNPESVNDYRSGSPEHGDTPIHKAFRAAMRLQQDIDDRLKREGERQMVFGFCFLEGR